MNLDLFPTSPAALYTVIGAIVFCVLATQWIKSYLPDWRFTSLLAFGLALLAVEVAGMLILYKPGHEPIISWMVAQQVFSGFVMAFVAASISTYGFELIVNLLGVAGVGPRSPAAQMNTAVNMVASDPVALARVSECSQ